MGLGRDTEESLHMGVTVQLCLGARAMGVPSPDGCKETCSEAAHARLYGSAL